MLFLLFNIGPEGYALPADRILQVLPNLQVKAIRGAAPTIAGSLYYRGEFLPVIDVVRLETGRATVAKLGTRIVIVEVAVAGRKTIVGLLLESATEMLRCGLSDFQPFAQSPRGLVQLIDLDSLLPDHIFASLPLEMVSAT